MTSPTPPPARMPAAAPTQLELEERDRFAELTSNSLSTVTATAQTWRNGLAAFITLVTSSVIIKGRSTTTDLELWARILVTLFIGAGLVLSVVGLWLALAAEAGIDARTQTLASIRARYGSLQAYEVASAADRAGKLVLGRRIVGAALACLLIGIALTWWAPGAASTPPAYLRVKTGATTWCGELKSADGGKIRLKVSGYHDPVVIPMSRVANMRVTASCP